MVWIHAGENPAEPERVKGVDLATYSCVGDPWGPATSTSPGTPWRSTLRSFVCMGALGLALLGGCGHQRQSQSFDVPACPGPPSTDRSALGAAPAFIARAVAKTRLPTERDQMLRLEDKLPGFGGWYIDSLGQVVVYMKPDSPASPALVRETIYQAYATRPEAIVRQVMAGAAEARIVSGDYTLSELIAIEDRIMSGGVLVPG
jgi:hypothetical protein